MINSLHIIRLKIATFFFKYKITCFLGMLLISKQEAEDFKWLIREYYNRNKNIKEEE